MVYITAMPPEESLRREHYAGWALLRLGLMELDLCEASVSADALMDRALKGEHGKPYFKGGPEFSISHSRGLIACAVYSVPVGLDLERVREFSPGLRGKICTAGELGLTGGDNSLLTQLWTCKESHMKLTGRGFSQGLLETEFSSLGECPELSGDRECCFYSMHITHAGQEFWLTLCSRRPIDFQIRWTDYSVL